MKAKYTDKQIIDRMKSLPSFQYIPGNLHMLLYKVKKIDLMSLMINFIYLMVL